ncbi:MAG: hypothetical protein H6813_03830 [Phycisphaeraceae bacterium]|nr:hypothetical protein [Phycisphaeraceae bacterium]MCB9847077.1 hypothetical protein [Phycisphaeraceae bacterium]
MLPHRRRSPSIPLVPMRVIEAFDPGWLYCIAGAALLVATVLIPVHDDRLRAEHHRDAAIARRDSQTDRLEAYGAYLDALNEGDDRLYLALAATQLNLAPEGKAPVILAGDDWTPNTNIYADIEPAPRLIDPFHLPDTRLRRWTTDPTQRLWLIAAGAICVLVGLMPPATKKS